MRDGVACHRLWIEFLVERYVAVRLGSAEESALLVRMVLASLAAPELLSTQPDALPVVLMLVSLALTMVFSGFESRQVQQTLRLRAYKAAFAWFRRRPVWYSAQSMAHLAVDAEMLCNCCRLLEADAKGAAQVSFVEEADRP